jgi:hypothetical protein
MDYKKCIILPPSPQRKIPSPNHLICKSNSLDEEDSSRYRYELTPEAFDPFGTSPPQIFMLKLKERLGMNQAKEAQKIKDFMRDSE